MPRKKPMPLETAEAAYAALSQEDKATFCHALMTDGRSPVYFMLCSMVADNFKLSEQLEAMFRSRRGPANKENPFEVLRLKEKLSWSRLAARLGISVDAARKRHARAKAKLNRETAHLMSAYP